MKKNLLSDTWFKTTLYSIGDAVITIDIECNVLQMNHVAEELTGWDEKEAYGKNIEEIFRIINESTRKPVDPFFKKIIADGIVVDLARHTLLITKGGKERPITDSASPIKDTEGRILGIVIVFRDQTREREAERRIFNSEKRLFTLLSNLPGMAYRCGDLQNWIMQFVNDGCRLLTGYRRAELINNHRISFNDIIHPDDRDHVHNSWRRAVTLNTSFRQEYRITRKDGNIRWVLDQGLSVISNKGDNPSIEGFITDITDYKQTLTALHESQEMLQLILNTIPARVFWKDRNSVFLGCNRAFARDAGLTDPEKLIGKTDFDMVWSNEADMYRGDDRRVMESGESKIGFEEPQTTEHGDTRWLRTSKIPLKNRSGEIIGILGTYEVITERVLAEKALRESEEKFRSLFAESKDTIYITSTEGYVLDINPAGLELFGYDSEEEIKNINISDSLYWAPEDREEYKRAMEKNGYVKDHELVLKRKDGGRISVLDTSTTVYDANNKPVAYRGIIRDITKQRSLEEQLLHAQKMESIGTLAGGIAHDFNNILGIIMGHASLIKTYQSDPLRLNRSVEVIQKSTERGASLVQQLLTFARKTDVRQQSVRINDIVREVEQLLRETMPKTISLRIILQSNLPSIVADITQIHQVLLNLAINARDAMPHGGTLSITTATVEEEELPSNILKVAAKNYILLKVTDTGIGMDAKTRQRIFDPFFTTKGPGKGSGLGLALVYSIVESYNGFVDVKSKPGAGTTFDIYLPVLLAQAVPESIVDQISPGDLRGNEKILLIEDEELLIDSVQSILERHGYSVIIARDGSEGVELFKLHSSDLFGKGIDLVISDIGLPKLGGEEVYRRIKKIDPLTEIILASGYIDPQVRLNLKNMGARYFIQKPYLPVNVLNTLRTVLDKKDQDT